MTRRLVPIELYLRYPGKYKPDAEYVDGHLEKRPPGDWTHSSWNGAILHWLSLHADHWNIHVLPSLRIRVAPTRVRVPDISAFHCNQPIEQVPTYPPFAVFEVLSPEDTMNRIMDKFADFAAMGVRHIWAVEPETGLWRQYRDGKLYAEEYFGSPADKIHFPVKKIAAYVD